MKVVSDIIFKAQVKKHLVRSARERGEPWRDRKALSATVSDVLSLDEDLLTYVRTYLDNNAKIDSSIRCEVVSIQDLVKCCGFDPLTAALTLQWFRREPRAASAFLAQHDEIRNTPIGAANEINGSICEGQDNSRKV